MIRIILFFAILFVSTSCTTKLSPENFSKYVEDPENGLVLNKEMGKVNYKVKYLPPEFMAIKEYTKNKKEPLPDLITEFNNLQYFIVEFSNSHAQSDILKEDLNNLEEYYQRLDYLSFPAQHDFFLLDGKDTLSCVLYHYERSYNLSPYHKILLAFPKNRNQAITDKTLVYQDRIFNTGKINFCIKKEYLQKTPKLIL